MGKTGEHVYAEDENNGSDRELWGKVAGPWDFDSGFCVGDEK